ncbi:hypothetical protein V8F33_009000 [Rhypophila sp. PSN 637]
MSKSIFSILFSVCVRGACNVGFLILFFSFCRVFCASFYMKEFTCVCAQRRHTQNRGPGVLSEWLIGGTDAISPAPPGCANSAILTHIPYLAHIAQNENKKMKIRKNE